MPWPLADIDGAIAATNDGKTLFGLLWLARELQLPLRPCAASARARGSLF